MYPTALDGTATYDLCQEFSSGDFQSQKIPNDLGLFEYGGEGLASDDRRSIA